LTATLVALSFGTAALAVVLVMVFARDASAQGWEPNVQEPAPIEPADLPPVAESRAPSPTPIHFEVGAVGAYVTAPIRGGANPFGIGFGGRIGITVDEFYFGANVLDFLGDSDVDVSYRSLLAGVEAGYDVRIHLSGPTSFVLRPQIGVGDAIVYFTDPSLAKVDVVSTASGSSSSSSSDTISVNNVYVDPGATVMLTSGLGYLSLNASVLLLPGIVYGGADATTWVSYGTRASAGLRF
jgi:hypothetical protein